MGQHSTDQIKADAATISKGLCPECFAPLADIAADAHAEEHWPEPAGKKLDRDSDAARRKRLVIQYQAGKGKKSGNGGSD